MCTTFIKFFITTICTLFFISASFAAEINDSATQVKWGYKGSIDPENWAQLNPHFNACAQGLRQSPIDIPRNVVRNKSSLKIQYRNAPLILLDDGNTSLQLGKNQIVVNDGHTIQLNFSAGTQEKIIFDEDEYRLVQLHFHTPSENQWRHQSFPLEIHFVHQGTQGKLAVIGVFIKGGKENASLKQIITHAPKKPGQKVQVEGEEINPKNLLPSKQSYYTFAGSLTTPPCTEGVTWILMPEPITASPAQIMQLRKAIGDVNARPIQALNGRTIIHALRT